jgi:hypothetical protein
MSLLDKMLKAGSVKGSSILSKSDFLKQKILLRQIFLLLTLPLVVVLMVV